MRISPKKSYFLYKCFFLLLWKKKIKKQDQIDIQELLKGQLDEITHNFKQK